MIVIGIALGLLILPIGIAIAEGHSDAIQGLVYALKANIQAYGEFLEYLAKGSSYEAPSLL
jgi:hypothetical protein